MSVLIREVPFVTDELQDCFSGALESLLRYHNLDLAQLHFDGWHFSLAASASQRTIAAHTGEFADSLALWSGTTAATGAGFHLGVEAPVRRVGPGKTPPGPGGHRAAACLFLSGAAPAQCS
ncbi:MAG: hypothetical protein FJY95_23855 [Candidatus Handelsmanbacteria bacterium]|nr:hypothetical protein [Candidatus Handelsmanbacteria bacterium]